MNLKVKYYYKIKMKLLLLLTIFGFTSAIKLNQYLDSSCSNLFQTYYFKLNDCFSAGNGANAMNYTFCNGTYFSASIYSGTTCAGNPVLTMSGDPLTCGLDRRLVYCSENAPPASPIIKSDSSFLLINPFIQGFLMLMAYCFM